jgi:alpha-L-fucosidase 2
MASALQGYGGSGTGFAYYQDFGDIYFDFAPKITLGEIENYERDLDMNTAVASVNYSQDGVDYRREYFSSYPDNVQAGRLSASKARKLTFKTSLTTGHMGTGTTFSALGDTITMKGVIANSTTNNVNPTTTNTGRNGLRFEAQIKLIPVGGTMTANADGTISIVGADSVDFIFTTGTDYKNEFPKYRGADPHDAISQRIAAAADKGYTKLLQDHLADYQELFSRTSLSLGEDYTPVPTDELVQAYRAGTSISADESRALEIMAFQFGRYLMIAGSREGTLPLNLQGVWGIGQMAWYGDYHFNINLQMNYWPAMSGNLAECMPSLIEYVDSLREPGGIVAERNYNARGFVVNCFSNIYGYTASNTGNESAGNNPAGASWILQNIYDYYRYTGDKEYLRDTIYPIMKDVADFWEDYLWYSPYQQRLVVAPSTSPEHGPTAVGTTYDQSLVWQFYEEIIDAANELGVDADKIPFWRDMQSKLKPIMVGDDGQVKEWFEETSVGKAKAGTLDEITVPQWQAGLAVTETAHRHASHLVGLYPGTLINKDNKTYMDAAKYSLVQRTMAGSGWSKAHKINLWARTLDGDSSYDLVKSMLKGGNAGILENLLDSHGGGTSADGQAYMLYPIFQIDGNFGLTSGIIEMLIQSQLGYTQFLPAIPAEWSTGEVKGLVARGDFVVDMAWSNGAADTFNVTSRDGGTFTGEYNGISNMFVSDEDGKDVSVTKISADRISFNTVKGKTYTISKTRITKPDPPIVEPPVVTPPVIAPPLVQAQSIKSAVISGVAASKVYTGKAQTMKLAVKLGGKTLVNNTDYTVSYKNNTNIGKATVTVTGKGGYADTKTASFKIVPQKPELSKVTVGKKQIKITWEKALAAQNITGWQVRYKVKGTSKWTTKTLTASKISLTVKKLKKGKAYVVQLRSYKTVSKVKYYSAWSASKTSKKVK